MLNEFKKFALRGSVVDLAVGFIIGGAFGTIVKSLVADVLMPPLGLLVGNVDFTDLFWVLREGATAGPYATLADAQAAGAVTLNYGVFITSVVGFLIIALALFFVVRWMNRLQERRKPEEAPAKPTTKTCEYCISPIPIEAKRCPQCTSDLAVAA